jgi:hypothetical protein
MAFYGTSFCLDFIVFRPFCTVQAQGATQSVCVCVYSLKRSARALPPNRTNYNRNKGGTTTYKSGIDKKTTQKKQLHTTGHALHHLATDKQKAEHRNQHSTR